MGRRLDRGPGLSRAAVPVGVYSDQPLAALARARWWVAVGGMADLRCNGERVGDWVLAPDHTDYLRRVSVLTVDLAPFLHDGANVWG